MKTAILSGFYPANMMKVITALTILFFWILNQNVYSADSAFFLKATNHLEKDRGAGAYILGILHDP